jgi:hypothetical protein
MLLYQEEAASGDIPSPVLSYSTSNDGVTFGAPQTLFGGSGSQDHFVMTPALVTKGQAILGVLYGANAVDLLSSNAIYSRWLQKQIVITDSTGAEYKPQGGYGPDRQWFQISGPLTGTITIYAEDGVTPLAKGTISVNDGS